MDLWNEIDFFMKKSFSYREDSACNALLGEILDVYEQLVIHSIKTSLDSHSASIECLK